MRMAPNVRKRSSAKLGPCAFLITLCAISHPSLTRSSMRLILIYLHVLDPGRATEKRPPHICTWSVCVCVWVCSSCESRSSFQNPGLFPACSGSIFRNPVGRGWRGGTVRPSQQAGVKIYQGTYTGQLCCFCVSPPCVTKKS